MSRTGIPMYSPSEHAYTFVTVERGNKVKVVRFRGTSCKANRAAAKKHYPDATRLDFGKCVWITD